VEAPFDSNTFQVHQSTPIYHFNTLSLHTQGAFPFG